MKANCPRCESSLISKNNKFNDSYCMRCGFRDLSSVFYEGPKRDEVQKLFMQGILEGRGYHRKEFSKSIQRYAKEYYHQRKILLSSCEINDLTKKQIKILFNNAFKCAICSKQFTKKKRTKSIDHIIPLNKGGNNTLLNIQVVCRNCNSRKSDKDYTLFNNGQLLLFV